MNTILIVLLPILFIIGFQAGRDNEAQNKEKHIRDAWLQPCDFNKERGLK